MSSKRAIIVIAALCLSLFAAFLATPGSWDFFRFSIGNYDKEGETQSVKSALRLFSATLAGFYVTGGNTAGLNMFPADKLVKRRIFEDINIYQQAGEVLAMDRDQSVVRGVVFLDPDHAVALVDEVWYMERQNVLTRRPVSVKKTNNITVRYLLKKMWSRWIVLDFEVYGGADQILPTPQERFLQW